MDEKGNYVNCAAVGALIAERMLKRQPKAKIGYTILTSRIYEETIKANGGKPVIARVGHAFIKQKMREKDVVFACEHSGHFYFKDYFYTDSVTLTLLAVLEAYAEAKEAGKSFSEMMKPYVKYRQTEDVIVRVKDKKLALAKIEQHLKKMKPKQMKKFDGFSVDFGEVWGAIKPSVTEFAIKLMFEAKKKKLAKDKQTEMVKYIKSIADKTGK